MNFKSLESAKEYLGELEWGDSIFRTVLVNDQLVHLTYVKVGDKYYWLTKEEQDEIATTHW